MNQKEIAMMAQRLMSCPVAPFHEAGVRAVVELICAQHELDCRRDKFGNVLVHLGDASAGRPLVLAAHMDHPGFEILRALGPRRWLARFNGGVPDDYFRRGIPLRLLPGATLARLGRRPGPAREFEIETVQDHPLQPRFAVWEMEDFAFRRGCIHGRACDDLVGVAAVLATLIELKRARSRVPVIGVISRAEEVGFLGALTVAWSKKIPEDSLVISLETSKELPPIQMGEGVIIRVGDRSSVFDATATRYLMEVAAERQAMNSDFAFQRALMSGGTCEATAYQEFGFQCAAVCVALGNYHNCGPRRRIAAEFVSLSDVSAMVELLVSAAGRMRSWSRLTGTLPTRLNRLLSDARRQLQRPRP